MYVRRLELVDFRSYQHAIVEFEPGCSVLLGPNGVGKTNLLEALHYVSLLDSHRVALDAPLVRAGATSAVIRSEIVHSGRSLLVELSLEPGRANRARLGGAPTRRPREILGALRMVLFAPEDLALIRGDPAERRRYLDDLLVARQPRYAAVRADYERVLKQRNALLRTAYLARKVGAGPRDLSTLDVWDVHLAQHGAELMAGRLELCAALGPHVAKAYAAVAAGKGAASLAYRPGVEGGPDRPALVAALAEALKSQRQSEVDRGVTLVGPHRDDLTLTLGDLPAKGDASHGQAWPRGYSGPGPDPRDPQPFGAVLAKLVKTRGWTKPAAEATIFGDWPKVAGAEVAEHCRPVKLEGGELTIEAESTAWATQLRLLAAKLLAQIAGQVGHNVVTKLHIHGPAAPSWARGPRRVQGRGPRDTYG